MFKQFSVPMVPAIMFVSQFPLLYLQNKYQININGHVTIRTCVTLKGIQVWR